MKLSKAELERYDRQMRIPKWGTNGQERLKASRVAVVGIGGLGCLSSLYLAAAGIGKITLVDRDNVRTMDLNRQILYCQRDIGRPKAEAAREKLEALNPEIKVQVALTEITKENIFKVLEAVDVIVDGLDNWKTRFILNDYCVAKGVPFVHAGVSEFYGQITTIVPAEGPCLRCIFLKEPPEVKTIPVLGATPALLASLQVMEAIKLITGIGKPLVGRMLFVDGEEMTFETTEVARNPNCPVCAKPRK